MTQKPVVLKEDIDDLHFPRGGGGRSRSEGQS